VERLGEQPPHTRPVTVQGGRVARRGGRFLEMLRDVERGEHERRAESVHGGGGVGEVREKHGVTVLEVNGLDGLRDKFGPSFFLT